MTPLSQMILENHQIRKTKKQKTAFIELMRKYHPELTVQEGGLLKSRNIIIGNPKKADVILTAHYDTCSVLPVANFITPQRPLLTVLYSLVLVIPIFLLVLLLNIGLNAMSNLPWLLHYFISIALYFGLLALLVFGPANKHTANDNTSGVITLCEILDRLPESLRQKTAVVFFDHEETGLFGSQFFRKKNKKKMESKLLINFDCVSDGDFFLLAATKEARQVYGEQIEKAFVSNEEKTVLINKMEKVYYPSDHAGFPVAVAVAALKHKPYIGYYIDRIHTNRDTIFDERNIDFLCTGVHSFLESL